MKTYTVTSELVTPESAECGECESSSMDEFPTLREAIEHWSRCGGAQSETECVEASDSFKRHARCVSIVARKFDGNSEVRTLHIPESATQSTRARLCRLLGA